MNKGLRLSRLFRHHPARLFVVPLDHSLTDGPFMDASRLAAFLWQSAIGGVDAVVLHKGRVPTLPGRTWLDLGLIVHLSASTSKGPDPDDKVLVASVEEALAVGADAVSVHVNIGSHTEPRQLSDLGAVADACQRWGVPLLAMMYVRGPGIPDPPDQAAIAHAAAVAVDCGADIVKTQYAGSCDSMRDIVRTCPIPLVVAGGSRLPLPELLQVIRASSQAGASGAAVGRNVFLASDVEQTASAIFEAIHESDAPQVSSANSVAGRTRSGAG